MKILLLLLTTYLLSCNLLKEDDTKFNIYSKQVKDSFEITIIKPKNYNSSTKYQISYFLDANINSGKALIKHINNLNEQNQLGNNIFVGIGHIGDFHVLRRRDFLPPIYNNGNEQISNDKNYGHADAFYLFLKNGLIPKIENKYNTNGNRSIIGHSFGGLFAYYSLLKENRLFNNHFALSPSLWVDDNNIFERETYFKQTNSSIDAYLYMATGTLEFLNFVLPTSRKMNSILKERNYQNFKFEHIEKQFANHNSHVPLTMEEVVAKIKQLQ